jgi:hypothetical protein
LQIIADFGYEIIAGKILVDAILDWLVHLYNIGLYPVVVALSQLSRNPAITLPNGDSINLREKKTSIRKITGTKI